MAKLIEVKEKSETVQSSAVPGWIVFGVGWLLVLASGVIFLLHLVAWLKHGTWPHYTSPQLFYDLGLAYPKVSWAGVQRIIDWIMSLSAATLLFWLGLGVSALGACMYQEHENTIGDEYIKNERDKRRRKTLSIDE